MANTGKFLHPIRRSLTVITSSYSSISHSTQLFYRKCEPLKTWTKRLDPVLHNRASVFQFKLSNLQRKYIQNFCLSGSKSIGSIFGVSVIFGSISFWPPVAYAMDGRDILVDKHRGDFFGASDMEEDPQAFWMFIRKFWLPSVFFLTVLVNWDHPITLVMKIVLFLLSTKPSPLSVYLFVEQLCYRSMRQEPHLYKLKSLYANKVEVQDYKFLCLARVEVGDQKLTLVGILGGWWALPSINF